MTVEVSIFGVLVPTLLIAAIMAYVVTGLVTMALRLAGAYRLIWHPALFNLSLFICVLGAAVSVLSSLQP